MNNVLNDIIASIKDKIAAQKKIMPLEVLQEKCIERPLEHRSLLTALKADGIKIIAEIKRASPSAGEIVKEFDPSKIARDYAQNGAAALSVLTEEKYFKGNMADLIMARAETHLPILRKDFIIDEYQIYESALEGADAILLISELLTKEVLKQLIGKAREAHVECLVECHSGSELEKILALDAPIIGINNRNLMTLEVDPSTAEQLIPKIPADRTVVIESGIRSKEDIQKYVALGAKTFLIGETLMRGGASLIKELKGIL
jgi:indole-3-glycerol phosphate synthase